LALRAAYAPKRHISSSAPLFGATTTYYALATDDSGGALVRFRTDGRAHVSRRAVVTPSSYESVVVPSSARGSTVVAMKVAEDGMNVVTVDGAGRIKQLTKDGHSSHGLLTPARRVLFVTTNERGESSGLAEMDLSGRGRRSVFRETNPDAVLSLPTLSASGRTAFLVRNVFDPAGQPQSYLLSIDVRTGRLTSRPLPGMNYVVSTSTSPDGRSLGFVGYRAADNVFARSLGFRAEADVIPVVGGNARRVAWVQEPFVVFSRGGSRLIVGNGTRLESVALVGGKVDPMYGTEGLSLPVLVR
jgi:Tol biopolymer transport system component